MKGVAKSNKSAKGFQITVNEIDELSDVLNYLRGLSPNYLVAAREIAPTTGHKHAHIYVQFPNARRLSVKKLCGAHVEKCLGSPEQNIAYIKKDGDIVCEEGTPRLCYVPTIKEAKAMPAEKLEMLNLNFYNTVKKINNERAKTIKLDDWHKEVKVTYISGPSGSGKSHMAYNKLKEEGYEEVNIVKYEDGFWHNVTDTCPCCIYDDWRDQHMKPNEFITFLDYNVHPMNIKGGSIQNKYKRIIITTVQALDSIYPNVPEEPRQQWERRIQEKIQLENN